MNASQSARSNKFRVSRTFRLAPTTRAIRAALAVSATMLALSGSGVAFAGTCVSDAPDTMSCNGVFTETVPGTIFVPTVDLTLILGDSAPTSVVPATGDIGVEADWGGIVGITSFADISTVGADGIHQYGSTSATLSNYGSIGTNVTADDANAVDISAYGDVTVVNDGEILAYGSGLYDVTAVTAYALTGNISITNQDTGTIIATASDGNAIAVDAYVFAGRAVVNNDGDIAASSATGDATGVHAQASGAFDAYGNFQSGAATVLNNGSIAATADNGQAVGVYAGSLGFVSISNNGDVSAIGDLAIGIQASGSGAFFNNTGTVSVTGADLAIGVSFSAGGRLRNTGSITATALYGDAVGISVDSAGTTYLDAYSGTIMVTGVNAATGIAASGLLSLIRVDGDINVTATNGVATGVVAHDVTSTGIRNRADIEVLSSLSSAVGIDTSGATAYYVAIINDDGTGSGGSILVTGADAATGILASASYSVQIANAGSIIANAGTGDAIGVFGEVYGAPQTFYASVIDNSGTISASSDYGNATGIGSVSDRAAVIVDNAGDIAATAELGLASGIRIVTGAYATATAINSGSIEVSGYQAVGIDLHGYAGGVYANNSGDITVAASAILARAAGIFAESNSDAVRIENSGGISVTVGLADATGIQARALHDSATVVNTGDIDVHSNIDQIPYGGSGYSSRDYSYGIRAHGEQNVTISNTGNIAAEATIRAQGLEGYTVNGLVIIDNAGAITATADLNAWGIEGFSLSGDVAVNNSGSIMVANPAGSSVPNNYGGIDSSNFGIFAGTWYGDQISVVNSGSISVNGAGNGTTAGQYGIDANLQWGASAEDHLVSVVNSGDIQVSGGDAAIGIRAYLSILPRGGPFGTLLVSNSGDISLESESFAYGIHATNNDWFGDGYSIVDNSGSITVATEVRGVGIQMGLSLDGVMAITNSGDITVSSQYTAIGVYGWRSGGDDGGVETDVLADRLTFDNSGSISATSASVEPANHWLGAKGVDLRAYVDTTVSNSGSITATTVENGTGSYAGGYADGLFVRSSRFEDALIDVSNTGSITSSAISNGRDSTIRSPVPLSVGVFLSTGYGGANVTNAGDIGASGQTNASAVEGTVARPILVQGLRITNDDIYQPQGITSQGDVNVGNSTSGSITASAVSYFGGDISASAAGIYASLGTRAADLLTADHGLTIDNAGTVSASALIGGADTLGAATATGIFAASGSLGFVNVSNAGTINATATAIGQANAIGVHGIATDVTVALAAGGSVSALAIGISGSAIGLSVTGDVITASNAGILSAEFVGAGDTYGALISSLTGEVTFTNSGSITATNADHAVGVQLDSLTATTLINSGSITSVSVTGDNLAVRTGASIDAIQNTGTINGGLFTGDGDDTFDNAVGGIWNTTASSDFGAGDDTIINAGMINLDNATITLGGFAASGNVFTNTGTIRVAGDTNTIDLDAGNPLAFTNTGTISFQDGMPDDRLTIIGDFAGQGSLDMDVSQLNNAGDLLYINGNVVDGSVTTINTHVLDLLPTAATGTVAVVNVSGDSSADSFVLGDVTFDSSRSFLTVQAIGLQSEIDASNATADVFSIDFAVNGLSETGALAAAFVPAVQRLMNSQVGTWRQRMGVIDKMAHGPSVWARAFSDNGTVNPSHQESNFGQDGDLAFDQRSSGEEVGVDYAFNEAFSVGLLVGKAQASQSLNRTGLGSSKLDGNTNGVYATWISPAGFYVDASYRRMSFDAKLNSAAGQTRTDGQADAFNVEAGYAWTLGEGLKLEPQLQYTHTTIDEVDTLEGAMAGFTPEEGTSSRARAGVAVRKSFDTGRTVWTPYATLSAVREFDGDYAYSIDGAFFGGTSTEGTSALVEGGLNVRTGNLSFSGGVNWQDGGALESVIGGQLGVRYSW
jgi:outer membrane autotransporter protein